MNRHLGDVFQANWYRVIIDKEQAIKNIRTTSESSLTATDFESQTLRRRLTGPATHAACSLRAKSYWALSGPPLANSAVGEPLPFISASLIFFGVSNAGRILSLL